MRANKIEAIAFHVGMAAGSYVLLSAAAVVFWKSDAAWALYLAIICSGIFAVSLAMSSVAFNWMTRHRSKHGA